MEGFVFESFFCVCLKNIIMVFYILAGVGLGDQIGRNGSSVQSTQTIDL